MATRTEPIASASFFITAAQAGPGAESCWVAGLAAGALGGDELLQPADLAFTRVQSVSLQLEGVRVEPLGGPRQRLAQPLPTLLDLAAAALQDPQPGVLVGTPEAPEVQPETR